MDTIVQTKYGKVEGKIVKGDLIQWLGVPFAKPPVGKLRFKRAEACEVWQDVKQCHFFKCKPIQFTDFILTKIPESEDCLHLNIIRANTEQVKLPVIVWLYGGNFIFGESSDPNYDGSLFAKNGVLFVSFNYRLGALGYFDFSIYDNQNFHSNCGFSDQIMALKWIKDNILFFGGDPDNITLVGESAGAVSVSHMLAAPSAKDLFHKAIMQSCLPEMLHTDKTSQVFIDMFLKSAGLEDNQVSGILNMSITELKRHTDYVFNTFSEVFPGFLPPSNVMDDLIPISTLEAIESGIAANKKIIIGTNEDESSYFIRQKRLVPYTKERIENMFKLNKLDNELDEVLRFYKGITRKESEIIKEFCTDRYILIDSIKLAKRQSKFNDVWFYRFDYVPPILKLFGLGAIHTIEIPVVFGNLDNDSLGTRAWKGVSLKIKEKLVNEIHLSWVNFVKTGNPNIDQDGHTSSDTEESWCQYNMDTYQVMVFDKESYMLERTCGDRLALWNNLKFYK